MEELTRRRVLVSSGALAVGGLAGCVSGGDDENGGGNGNGNGGGNGDENGGDTGSGNGDENGDDTGSENGDENSDDNGTENGGDNGTQNGDDSLDVTIETTNTDCAGADNDTVDVEFGDEKITVSGVTPASTPCHDAIVTESSLADGGFTLTVDVEKRDEMCTDCTGQVSYEAQLEGDGVGDISEGTVRHVQGGTHGIAMESSSASAEPLAVGNSEMSKLDAGCRSDNSKPMTTVTKNGDTLEITGTVHTNNPCYEPVLSGMGVDGATLSVGVDVRSTDDICQQCLGAIRYRASIELSDVTKLDGVTVDYQDGDTVTVDADAIETSA
jgi:hypothetical protein